MLRGIFLLLLLTAAPALAGDVEGPASCVRCGMDRAVFSYSRAQVSYGDGSSAGTCSIHCAVEDTMKSPSKRVVALRVADYRTRELIEARSATWVVGGKARGVMTSPAKWAFATREEADAFIRENGGTVTPFEQVLKALRLEVEEMDRPPEME